jgi:hypothetical protein
LSRGSNPCGYPHKPLVSYRINRQLSGWIPPPLMIRAFGAHCHLRTLCAAESLKGWSVIYLLDYIVGAREQHRRNFKADRAGGRQVDDQFKLG